MLLGMVIGSCRDGLQHHYMVSCIPAGLLPDSMQLQRWQEGDSIYYGMECSGASAPLPSPRSGLHGP